MMNNITQVSPGNRVDFSRIRKALIGTKIPKFLNPYKKLDLTNSEYQTRLGWEGLTQNDFFTDGQYDYAKMYDYYLAHPELFGDLSSITATPTWEGALRNTKGFADWNSQFNSTGLNYFFGYDANKADYFGPTTSARKGFLEYLKTRLAEKPEPEEPTIDEPVKEENSEEQFEWSPMEYSPVEKPLSKFRFPTFPLYNAALLGIANLTNKRILDTRLKAPTMRYEAPTLQGKITDAYYQRSANEQALQEQKWGIQLQIDNTSDLGTAQKAERDLRAQELATQMLNNKEKSTEYNQTSQNLQNLTNTNKQTWANTANLNRQAWVADARDRLNAIAQYQAQRGLNIQENIMSNYTDWKAWNRNNMLQDYADWQANEGAKVQLDLLAAWDEYQNSGDITKWEGYGNLWSNNMLQNGEPDPTTELGKEYANWLRNKPGAQASDPALQKQFLEEHEGLSFNGELDGFWKNWADYKSNAMQNYIKNRDAITTDYSLLKARYNPIQFNGEVSPWLWRAMNGAPPTYTRRYMKKGGRFLEYLEHNRKAEKDIRDTTMKSMQESRRMLRRDLDALDRESLLLLRAIFK